jgi:hypothetical protein
MTTAAFITGYLGKTAAASPIFGAEGWTADTGIGRTNENNASRDLKNPFPYEYGVNQEDDIRRINKREIDRREREERQLKEHLKGKPTLDGESSLPPLPDSWDHSEPPGQWSPKFPSSDAGAQVWQDKENPEALMDDAMKGNYPDQTHPDQDPPSWLSRWSSPEFEWGAEGQVTDAGVGAGIGSIASALLDFARDKPVSVRRMILMAIMGGAAGALFNAVGGWEGIKSTFPSSHPSIA